MATNDLLKVLDDGPVQILIAKAREQPVSRPIPIERARILLEPCECVFYARMHHTPPVRGSRLIEEQAATRTSLSRSSPPTSVPTSRKFNGSSPSHAELREQVVNAVPGLSRSVNRDAKALARPDVS